MTSSKFTKVIPHLILLFTRDRGSSFKRFEGCRPLLDLVDRPEVGDLVVSGIDIVISREHVLIIQSESVCRRLDYDHQ